MTLYPAIDLLGGKCVRLRRGDYRQARVYDADPLAVARRWQALGAEWLHIIDLDGARSGEPAHLDLVAAIVEATGLPVQLGGGLRREADIAAAIERGVTRVILGTSAARDPALLATSLARWGERVAVAVDAVGDRLAVDGWQEADRILPLSFAERMASLGVSTLVVTDVQRDGMLSGSDLSKLAAFRQRLDTTRLIAAGGIAGLDDVRGLAQAGFDGAVLGRALYAGTLDLSEALALALKGVRAEVLAAPELEGEGRPC